MSDILGTCKCGCGQFTRLAPVSDRNKHWIKGQPLHYIKGHSIKRKSGAGHPNWTGGKHLSSHGYLELTLAEGVRKYEHIVIAEHALGRTLKNFGTGHPSTEVVHHIDGDKTNNAPNNLLICTHSYHTKLHHRLELSESWPQFKKVNRHPNGTSRIGRSGFKGVHWSKRYRKWVSLINIHGLPKKLGLFNSPAEAAMAYDEMAIQVHGDNWITNRSLGLI